MGQSKKCCIWHEIDPLSHPPGTEDLNRRKLPPAEQPLPSFSLVALGWRGELLSLNLQWQHLAMTSWMSYRSRTCGPWNPDRAGACSHPWERQARYSHGSFGPCVPLFFFEKEGEVNCLCVLPLNIRAWKRLHDYLITSFKRWRKWWPGIQCFAVTCGTQVTVPRLGRRPLTAQSQQNIVYVPLYNSSMYIYILDPVF